MLQIATLSCFQRVSGGDRNPRRWAGGQEINIVQLYVANFLLSVLSGEQLSGAKIPGGGGGGSCTQRDTVITRMMFSLRWTAMGISLMSLRGATFQEILHKPQLLRRRRAEGANPTHSDRLPA